MLSFADHAQPFPAEMSFEMQGVIANLLQPDVTQGTGFLRFEKNASKTYYKRIGKNVTITQLKRLKFILR